MADQGQIFVESLPGHVRLRIEGSHPSMPWEAILGPQVAFSLGLELRSKAEDLGVHGLLHNATVRSGASPVRRPPVNSQASSPQRRDARLLPSSSAEVQSTSGPTPYRPKPADDLIGDTF